MDAVAERPVSKALQIGNALLWLAAAAVFAVLHARTESGWSLLLASSFALRAPVAFRHPFSWEIFTKPMSARTAPRRSFSPALGMLSTVSFLLLLAGVVLFASTEFR